MSAYMIGGMATIPSRQEACLDAIASIIGRLDRLYLAFQGEFGEFDWLTRQLDVSSFKSVRILYPDGYWRQLEDGAKFRSWNVAEGYFFSLDDDLIYSDDYVDHMLEGLDLYGRHAVVTLLGRSFHGNRINSFYRDKPAIRVHYNIAQPANKVVQVGGTGVMAFWNGVVDLRPEDWKHPNMADIHVARDLRACDVPIIALAHPAGLVKNNPKVDPRDSIWGRHKNDDTTQTRLVNEMLAWPIPQASL